MNILRKIFTKGPTSPFRTGERVQDPWGNKHTVIEADPDVKRFEVKRVRPDQSSASAYLRGRRIIIHGEAITNYGNLGCAPFVALNVSDSDSIVGGSLLQVLKDALTTVIPAALTDFKTEWAKGLQGIGIAPANKLSYGAVNCSVSMKPEELLILP